jgi:hypothetical protein
MERYEIFCETDPTLLTLSFEPRPSGFGYRGMPPLHLSLLKTVWIHEIRGLPRWLSARFLSENIISSKPIRPFR